MLLPDNIRPELSIYYNGAIVIEQLKNNKLEISIMDLYENLKAINNMSLTTYMLCLDWLYLIDVAIIDERGCIVLCS